MAFPSTGILDDFNRTEGPPPSSAWTTLSGYGGIEADGAQCKADEAGACGGTWNTSFNADQEAYITWTTVAGGDIALILRLDGSYNGYYIETDAISIAVYRLDAGSPTLLGGDVFTKSSSSGDSLGVVIVDSTISVYHKAGAGAWTLVGTRDGSAYDQAGLIGHVIVGTSERTDNFGGGNYIPSAGLSIPLVMAYHRKLRS